MENTWGKNRMGELFYMSEARDVVNHNKELPCGQNHSKTRTFESYRTKGNAYTASKIKESKPNKCHKIESKHQVRT